MLNADLRPRDRLVVALGSDEVLLEALRISREFVKSVEWHLTGKG
jgi:hypothetical protein